MEKEEKPKVKKKNVPPRPPKGNKYALGNNGGAPRTVSPSPEECIKLGEELLEWVKVEDEKKPRLRFQQFYSIEKMIIRKHWKSIIQTPEFLPYYQKAQAILAERCLDGTMEKSFGQRYIRVYDRDLIDEEWAELEFKAELARKKEININHSGDPWGQILSSVDPQRKEYKKKVLKEKKS